MNRWFPKHLAPTLRRVFVILGAGGLCGANLHAAVTVAVSPATVSNTYNGPVTLSVTGLNAGQTVRIQKFVDSNSNGAIDAADWLVQQFPLTDGQASVIGGVTNFNVPGDLDPAPGSIRARLNIQVGGIAQSFVGNYAFRVVSPAGQFTPITNFFSITNSAFAQSVRGVITCSGTNVPNATVLSFPGLLAETSPLAGVVADNSGAYTLNSPPGTYSLLPFKPGFVTDATALPMVTLNPGATLTTNLAMLPATRTISGRFVDAANPTNGLPGILVVCESADFRLAVGFTSTNGTFTVPVTAGLWRVSMDEEALLTSASVDVDTHPEADTTAGSVTNVIVALPKATALIYGSIKDDQNRPLADVSLWAEDTFYRYQASGITDQDGNYVAGVLAGAWRIQPDDSSPALLGYVVSQGADLTLADGQAVRQDFRVMAAPNRISGYVKDLGSNPVSGVGVYAWANLNGTNYSQRTRTDLNGYYSLNVANGTWSVGLSCGGGEDSLDSQGYQCVPEQPATVANNNVVINFIVQPCGALQVTTSSPLPNALATAYYSYFLEASGCYWPFTWSLAPGSQPLPPGMNLWPNGNLEGTPTAGGTYTFAVRVTDNHGSWTDRSLSLRVNASPTLSSPSRPSASQFRFQVNGVAGQTYTIQGSPDLNNWQNLGVTNAPVDSFVVQLESATNVRTYFRVLVGP